MRALACFCVILLLFAFQDPQPIRADQSIPSIHHTLALSFDLDQGTATGTSRIRIPAHMPLHLDCGSLLVTGTVLEPDGRAPLTIRPDTDNAIRLAPAPYGQTLFLSWRLETKPDNSDGNRISRDGIVLTGFWHPLTDRDLRFSLEARLPRGWTGVTEGDQLLVRATKSASLLRSSPTQPLRSLHLAAGRYRVRSKTVEGVTLLTYFFPEDAALAPGYIEDAAAYIRRYQQLLGPFPYQRYAIVENRLPTGYGMPGFTLLGQAVVRLPFIRKTSLAHEILHSWFGNSVGVADHSGNWCEGLTTYLADQWLAEEKGQGAAYRKNQILRYLAYAHGEGVPTLNDFRGAGDTTPLAGLNRAVGYDKGSLFFHMLREEVGDETFLAGLRDLIRDKRHARASWQDIREIFNRRSGRDLAPFFEQWLQRTDIPRLLVEDLDVTQENGQSRIRFSLIQDNPRPFRLKVKIRLETLSGVTEQIVSSTEKEQTFSLTTNTVPTGLVLDPDADILRQLTPREIPPSLVRFLGAAQQFVVLPADDSAQRYRPLAEMLQRRGATILRADEVKNSRLSQGSWLLAGDSALRRSLLAGREIEEPGFHLQVVNNPLAGSQVMVLVDADSLEETRAVLPRLLHYGKYARLDFRQGRIQHREIAPSEQGMRLSLLEAPQGIPVKEVRDFSAIMDAIASSRVVYVGETHTRYGDHLLQLQVVQALVDRLDEGEELALGMEMFPRSSQPVLDAYSRGEIEEEKTFVKKSGYFSSWGFDYRLYRGLLGFAARHHLPIIGLNLDKKIVSQVFRSGSLDDLTPEQLRTMALDRDLAAPGYRQRLRRIFGQHDSSPHGPGFGGFLQAQAIWDETMAETIVRYLRDHPESRMVIIAGTGHVYKDSAIPLRVARRLPGISQSVLVSVNGRDTGNEIGRRVDYLLFAPDVELPPAARIGVSLKEEDRGDGKEKQVRIVAISPHGHGREDGLEKDDIILAIDGEPVRSVADLKIGLLDRRAGDTVTLTVLREHTLLADETLDIPVRLSALPAGGIPLPPGHPKRKGP